MDNWAGLTLDIKSQLMTTEHTRQWAEMLCYVQSIVLYIKMSLWLKFLMTPFPHVSSLLLAGQVNENTKGTKNKEQFR